MATNDQTDSKAASQDDSPWRRPEQPSNAAQADGPEPTPHAGQVAAEPPAPTGPTPATQTLQTNATHPIPVADTSHPGGHPGYVPAPHYPVGQQGPLTQPGATGAAPWQMPGAPMNGQGPSGDPVLVGEQPVGPAFGQESMNTKKPVTLSRGAVIGLMLAGLVVSLCGGYLGGAMRNPKGWTNVNVVSDQSAGGAPERPAGSVAGIAQRVLPSVVAIETNGAEGRGTGSGFVLKSEGIILTNDHVVAGVGKGGAVTVIFADGSNVKGSVLAEAPSYDLAVVKVEKSGLPALELGDSSKVAVGDPVVAIGSPLGLQSTVTTGIISAMNRPVAAGESREQAFINAIQTDAAINPGNSGGPLVDMNGRVIGINSAIARAPGNSSSSGGSIGLGFAIPSVQAARTAEQLINTGKATYPLVGVMLDRNYRGAGVRVADNGGPGGSPITKGGPADRAGIKPGDLITKFQGRPVTAPDELIVAIRAQKPGDRVTLMVQSNQEAPREVTVELQESTGD